MFAASSSNGETKRLADLLGFSFSVVRAELGQLHVNRCAHTSTHICWARGNHAVVGGLSAATINLLLNNIDCSLEAVKDLVKHGAGLHTHDTEMILLTEPNNESLVLRVVASTAMGPMLCDTSRFEELILRHILEHNVLLDEGIVLSTIDKVRVIWGD